MATSLTVLQQRVQTLYDVQGSTVLSAAELTQFINDAYRALWDEVVAINKDFRMATLLFTLVTDVQAQPFPGDFAEVRYVRLNPNTDSQVYLTAAGAKTGSQQWDRSYRVSDVNVVIEPIQRCAGNYALDYIPQPPQLVNGGDTLYPELDRFQDFITYHAAIAALAREESDGGQFVALLWGIPGDPKQTGIVGRVRRWASDGRKADPDRVEDVRRRQPWMWAPP